MLLLPLLFCCALQRSCGSGRGQEPSRPPRTPHLVAGLRALLALPDVPGALWYCHQGLEGGAKWAAVAAVCRTESSHFTASGVGRQGKDGGGGGSGGGISPAFTMQALLECSAALLARLRAQPALLEGFVTLLALPA